MISTLVLAVALAWPAVGHACLNILGILTLGAGDYFQISTTSPLIAGQPQQVQVTVRNSLTNLVCALLTGTKSVHIWIARDSSDPQAGLPPKYPAQTTYLPTAGAVKVSDDPDNPSTIALAFSNGTATFTFTDPDVGKYTLNLEASASLLGLIGITLNSNPSPLLTVNPDHFTVSEPVLTNRAALGCTQASTFTYMGEEMELAFKLTAKNASDATTPNYTGDWAQARLDGNTPAKWTLYKDAEGNRINNSIGLRAINSDPTGKTLFDPAAASPRLTVSTSSGTWAAGVGSFTARVTLARPKGTKTPDGPFEFLDLGVAPRDADGREVLPGALDLDADNDGANERVKATQTKVRFGRLRLFNAHGWETLRLPVPLFAEYWKNIGFVTNRNDNCTPVPTPTLSKHLAAGGDTTASSNSTLVAGNAGLWLSPPGDTNSGYVDLTLTAPGYLKYNWNGTDDGGDGDWFDDDPPKARARFGIYKNEVIYNGIIYMRENY